MNNSRPYVSIPGESCLDELRNALDKNMDKMKEFDGIAGIMLDGGMSRGYADYLSEIDVVIFLHDSAFKSYKARKTPVSLGITVLDNYLYDVKTVNYEEELERDYDSTALWDLSYAEIIYDNNGELKKLFAEKLEKESEACQAEGLMFEVWWNYKLAGDIWIHRKDVLQGHYCLNNAVKPLISSLFIANREYIPHDKWLIHMSRTLAWQPDHYEELLKEILTTGEMDLESLCKRQQSIDRLWNAIDAQLCREINFDTGLKLMHRGVYQNLKKAVDKGEFTIEEWNEFSSISALNYEPLFSIAEVEGGRVIINKDKLVAVTKKDMYRWFFDIVDAVR
jgi:hypothetical protein